MLTTESKSFTKDVLGRYLCNTFEEAAAVGFGLVITALTVSLGLGHRTLAMGLRGLPPFVNRVGGGLIVAVRDVRRCYGHRDPLAPRTAGQQRHHGSSHAVVGELTSRFKSSA